MSKQLGPHVRVLQATVVFNFPSHVLQVLGDIVALNELDSLRSHRRRVALGGVSMRCSCLHALTGSHQAFFLHLK